MFNLGFSRFVVYNGMAGEANGLSYSVALPSTTGNMTSSDLWFSNDYSVIRIAQSSDSLAQKVS